MKTVLRIASALLIILAFSSFSKPENINPDTNYYKKAINAWKKQKNIPLALENMRLSYFQKPDSYRLYWYTYFLSREKGYDETVKLLDSVSESQWYPCAYGTAIYRNYAAALRKTGRKEDAFNVLIKAFRKKEKNSVRRARVLSDLVSFWYKDPDISMKFKKHPEYRSLVNEIIQWCSEDWNRSRNVRVHLFRHFLVTAVCDTMEGDPRHKRYVDLYMKSAMKMSETVLSDNKEYRTKVLFFKDAIDYWRKNYESKKETAYNFKFCCIFYSKIDAKVKIRGETVHRKHVMSRDFIEKRIAQNMDHAHTAAMAYFYFTRGKLLMSFDFKIHEATVHDVKGLTIVQESIVPHPGRLHFDNYNKYDGFMYFYDKMATWAFVGGAGPAMFSPYNLYSGNSRFRTWMKTGANYSVFIHEIFHNFESYYNIRPAHGYLEMNKRTWPAWFHSTVKKEECNAEISYYNGRFMHDINPNGLEAIKLRKIRRTTVTESVFKNAEKRYHSTSPQKVKQSCEHYHKGEALYKKRSYRAAMKEYKIALKIYPWNHRALYKMAWTTRWKLRDSAGAVKYYQQYLDDFKGYTYTGLSVSEVMWNEYWREKNYTKVIDMAEKYTQYIHDNKILTKIMFMKGVSLRKTGKTKEAKKLLNEALKLDTVWQKVIKSELAKCRNVTG